MILVRGEAGESLTSKDIQQSRKCFYFTRVCLTVCQATLLYATCYSGAMCQIAGARSYQFDWVAGLHWTAATDKPHSHLTPHCRAVPSPAGRQASRASDAAFFASTDVLINSALSSIVSIVRHHQSFSQCLPSHVDLRWYRGRAASRRAEKTSRIAGPPLPSDGSDQMTASEIVETSPAHTATFPVQLVFLRKISTLPGFLISTFTSPYI
jgi:hypothetical protein